MAVKHTGFDHLRSLAKKLKKEKGITYCQALKEIAEGLGYKSWDALIHDENTKLK